MIDYTIDKHIYNIDLLKELCIAAEKADSENEMFSVINKLSEFIQENPQYSYIQSFDIAENLLIDIINFSNSQEYNLNNFIERYINITNNQLIMADIIDKSYKINVYFVGIDRYELIPNIINKNINFICISLDVENVFKKKKHEFDVLILSEEATSQNHDLTSLFDKIIYYDKYINNTFILVDKLFYNNYDYNYLVNSITKAKNNNTHEIFVGHSYSLNGIDDTKLNENIVNLSLSSQDIYYSIKIAKEIIDYNSTIRKCYIGTGYWTFHFDLSKSKNNEAIGIEKIFYPIFEDSHHYEYVNTKSIINLNEHVDTLSRAIFNIDALYNCLSKLIYDSNKSYFTSSITRQSLSLLGDKNLDLLDAEEKYLLGKVRAEQHNKLIQYQITKEENKALLSEFLIYLKKRNVQPVIVNFPTSKYYNKFLDKRFKEEYYDIIESLNKESKLEFIDLNNNLFNDEDFRDFDHMSDLGAYKINNILKI
ncbi:hypothetical protein psyc5s11_46740 [Clostridium gelidum]|uniref:DUF1574 domain-containing protein n=1 Tax=Clostridium gelidum TaxID=704125 RepID=A0ABN6J2N2_9CLOT|nr:hypothetical protein [Clostridium gelidum]BCZ48607.1 hypothetical protein psyc5s11_46740 [Clostridium gelidum]